MRDKKVIGRKKKCPQCSAHFVVRPESTADEFESVGASSSGGSSLPPRRSARKPAKKRRVVRDEFEDGPATGKKRRSKKREPEKQESKVLLYVLIGMIPLLLCGIGALVYFVGIPGSGGGAIAEEFVMPEEYDTWGTRDSNFQFQYPKGWAASGVKKRASVEHGSIKISAEDSLVGSLFADISRGPGVIGEKPERFPVDDVHDLMGAKLVEKHPDWSEVDRDRLKNRGGNSHLSEYTYSTFFGGERKGYRLTLLNAKYQLNVLLECDADEFEQVKPLFEEMMPTFGPK
ncbi:hypothetical protein Pla110_09190 [Polystyrenella longa]|uniref:Uncharacterized protein n=2 Tax=Polystyrenella longa TaxID=2528007 RepID=A0A518CJ43_9PLAN|nr:hypothetical protein Pla110_09190 [Polystyrenella longa]